MIANKLIGIFPEKGGGTRQVTLSEGQRKQTVLTDMQILALADLGASIEAHYGIPQDIEWAIASEGVTASTATSYPMGKQSPSSHKEIASGKKRPRNDIFVLQSRPITSLFPIQGLKSPDDSMHIFFSMGHQQNMTNAMAPLSLSSFQQFAHSVDKSDTIVHLSGGRMFADITLALRHPILRRLIPALLSQFDALAPQVFRVLTQRPEFKRPNKIHIPLSLLKGVFKNLRRVFATLWLRDLNGFVERTNTLMDDYIDETTRDLRAHTIGKAQIQAAIDAILGMPSFFLHWVPEAAAGIGATRILPRLAHRYLSPEELEALTLGIHGNVVNEMNIAISDMAELARQTPKLADQFEHLSDDAQPWLENATKIEGSAPFFEAWDEFLNQYGSRGSSEIDIYMPRWQ